MTYDESFLYVFALIGEPEPGAGVVTGHNGNDVPYHDNDFEVRVHSSLGMCAVLINYKGRDRLMSMTRF